MQYLKVNLIVFFVISGIVISWFHHFDVKDFEPIQPEEQCGIYFIPKFVSHDYFKGCASASLHRLVLSVISENRRNFRK